MSKFKRLTAIVLSALMIVTAVPVVSYAAETTSGKCGDNVVWALDKNGTLTIVGEGRMTDLDNYWTCPWYGMDVRKAIIMDGVTSIGSYVFDYCQNLESVTIPDSVVSIGEYAFSNCISLKNITIPDSVTSIGQYAFYYCKSLTSITMSDSVAGIGEMTFYGCELLPSITIPDSVTSIAYHAFNRCDSLRSITIPSSVTSIDSNAFEDCKSLTAINVERDNTKYCSVDGVLYNKDKTELITYPTGKTEKNYVVPDGVTSVGKYAFYHCNSLTSVTIPDGVLSVGEYAFANCLSLTSVAMPNSVVIIGGNAFYCCLALPSIAIPSSVTSIGDNAFGSCTALKSIDVDSKNMNYRSVDGALFNRDMTELIQVPCGKTGRFTVPDGVLNIGDGAFYYCNFITSVVLPRSLVKIGMTNFSYISYESLLTDICYKGTERQWNAVDKGFGGISSNICVTLNYKGKIGGSCGDGITWEYDDDSMTLIISGNGAMNDYENWSNTAPWGSRRVIKNAIIENGVTKIGDYAFYYCQSLESITVPVSVTSIGNMAFTGCAALTDVYYSGTIDEWNNISIGSSNDYLTAARISKPACEHEFVGGICIICGEADPAAAPTLGDINNDGIVNLKDCNIIKRIITGIYAPDDYAFAAADIDGDKSVTSKDSYALKRMLLG